MTDAILASDAWPYIVVILVGFLPSEVWRILAVVLSRGLSERAEVLVWVRAVAITLLAAVVAKLLFSPSAALAAVPVAARFAAVAIGVGVYLTSRGAIYGVLAGEAALVFTAWWVERAS
jgi:branched-subunit amino acid transport protein AzlD